MILKNLILFSFLICINTATAQLVKQAASIGFQYSKGYSMGTTYSRLQTRPPKLFGFFYEGQMSAQGAWVKSKRVPKLGLEITAGNSGSKEHIGTVVGVSPYVILPLYTFSRFCGDFKIGFGLGWIEKKYGTFNTENKLIGSHINAFTGISWQNELAISTRHFIKAGVSFYHFSNGRTKMPNLGINIPSVFIGYRYNINPGIKSATSLKVSDFSNDVFVKLFLSAGLKQYPQIGSKQYKIVGLSAEIGKQISHSSIVSVGLLLSKDNSLKVDTLVRTRSHILGGQLGLYASYEYIIGRLSIPVQFGVYAYNKNSILFERVGFRYKISKQWHGQLLLKAHLHRADLFEFGVGYSIL